MKLNKRKCREFAFPVRKLQSGNGICHVKQVDYIVTAAIKNIACHRVLILYIYPRKQLAKGDCQPCYTVFQNKDDYITLERKDDDSTTWRKSVFDNLDKSYWFSNRCAFYSARDEACVSRYFKADTDSGFNPLIEAQDNILERRRLERQLAKEKAVIDCMAGIPALPRDLRSWTHKIMPSYLFYDYKCGNKDTEGVCSSCGQKIILSGVKQSSKHTCPYCKHKLIAKPRSRRGACMNDRETFAILQKMSDGRLVMRIIKVYYNYGIAADDVPVIDIYENARHFFWQDGCGQIHAEAYYYSYNSGTLTHWKKGFRPVFSQWQYNFEADIAGHLYTRNLPDVLQGTPWGYCPIDIFYKNFQEPMEVFRFLSSYLQHPRLEHLVKMGFYRLAYDLAFQHYANYLDERQNRTHRILRVAAEDVPFLQQLDVNMASLKTFQDYVGIKDRQELLLWQLEHDVTRNILPILRYITPHKMIRYLDEQYSFLKLRRTPQGTLRYDSMQALVNELRDYLEMCEKIGDDHKFPKDLQKSHDRVSRRLKHKTDAKLKRDFTAVYKDIVGKFDFEQNGMKIAYPATSAELIDEGNALHHCVGDYAGRVARRESVILFLRQCSDESKPFFTIEVRVSDYEILQVRGSYNSSPTKQVQNFISVFKQQVLNKLYLAA